MNSQYTRNKLVVTVLLSFLSFLLPAQVVINEFMATNLCSNSNPNPFQDNYEECKDWVEKYTTTAAPMDLSLYYHTDNIVNLENWDFPAGPIIPANGFLRVWLSARVNKPFNIN